MSGLNGWRRVESLTFAWLPRAVCRHALPSRAWRSGNLSGCTPRRRTGARTWCSPTGVGSMIGSLPSSPHTLGGHRGMDGERWSCCASSACGGRRSRGGLQDTPRAAVRRRDVRLGNQPPPCCRTTRSARSFPHGDRQKKAWT